MLCVLLLFPVILQLVASQVQVVNKTTPLPDLLSDENQLSTTLHVQYKPRFDEKSPELIYISEETVEQGAALSVNITCTVWADPVAKIEWFTPNGIQVATQEAPLPGQSVHTTITDHENMSILTVHYRSIELIKNTRLGNETNYKYICKAVNLYGSASKTFEIKVAHLPDWPKLLSIYYIRGRIILFLNESHIEPPIDIYRLEINNEHTYLFNKTCGHSLGNNNGYKIDLKLLKLTSGEHKASIFAHNPVGWSDYSNYIFEVESGARTLNCSWIATIVLLVAGQIVMGGQVDRFFLG